MVLRRAAQKWEKVSPKWEFFGCDGDAARLPFLWENGTISRHSETSLSQNETVRNVQFVTHVNEVNNAALQLLGAVQSKSNATHREEIMINLQARQARQTRLGVARHAGVRIAVGVTLAAVMAFSTDLASAKDGITQDTVVRGPAQSNTLACRVNGKLIVPKVDAVHTYGWGFVANFDHPTSTTQVTTCLAERIFGQPTEYTVANTHCAVTNNTANVQFGSGVAPFDGNAYLVCNISVQATSPKVFWVAANMIPNAVLQSYTFLSSSPVNFTANSAPGCNFRPTSQYTLLGGGPNSFTHSTVATCGSYVEVRSRLEGAGINASEGKHVVGGTTYGPVDATGRLALPATYTFNIAAAGQPYTLDWLVIDPTPAKTGGS